MTWPRTADRNDVHVVKVPDIGEGIAEVEVVQWHVRPGDVVVADQVIADVMTDKATVEIPSPVSGRVLALGGEAGEKLAVGSELLRLEEEGAGVRAGAGPAACAAAPAVPRRLRRVRARGRRPSPRPRCAATRASWGSNWRACRERAGRTGAARGPRAARRARRGETRRRPRATPSAAASRPCP